MQALAARTLFGRRTNFRSSPRLCLALILTLWQGPPRCDPLLAGCLRIGVVHAEGVGTGCARDNTTSSL